MRRIGVLTNDFSLYHDLVRLLRDRDVAFSSLAFGETPDPSIGVIITSWKDSVGGGLPKDIPVVAVGIDRQGHEDIEGAVAQALRTLEGVEGFREVVVGIDPGARPGVALVADGRLRHATQVFRVDDVAALVKGLLSQYPHEQSVIRVGDGAPPERDEILRSLWSLRDDGVRLELVDEAGTTPITGSQALPSDVAAAILIARTPGRSLSRPGRGSRAAGASKVPRRNRPSSV